MCNCVDVKMGSYKNSVALNMPESWTTNRSSRVLGIDKCLVDEIKFLWDNGIRTLECCCGHNITEGYIAVDDDSIEKMKSLGYLLRINHLNPDTKNEFKPKSV